MQTTMETAVMAQRRQAKVRHAVIRLLDGLRRWTRAEPRNGDDELPKHDIVFITGIDGGPERELANAMRSTPEIWAHVLPNDVCIVSRHTLENLGISSQVVDHLAAEGWAIVENSAALHLHKLNNT